MSKNKVQFQVGYSLIELLKNYGSETQCVKALFKWRWPAGFRCPQCGSGRHSVLKTRNLYQCMDCHHQTSLISGTIFEQTQLPLTTWFLAIHMITQSKTGLSALALKRQIGVSYNTAWSMKHKIMQVMKERDDSKPLSGTVQLDDVYWGGQASRRQKEPGRCQQSPFCGGNLAE
jgi:transposase-like protein